MKASKGLWLVSALALTGTVVMVSLFAPVWLLGLVAGGFARCAYVSSKATFVGSVGMLFLLPSLEAATSINALSLIDEGLVVFWLTFALLSKWSSQTGLLWPPGVAFFSVFALAGVASALLGDVPGSVWMTGSLLALKGVILGFASAQLGWIPDDLRLLVTLTKALLWVVLAGCIANLLAPSVWAALLAPGVNLDGYFGLKSLIGPFTRPAALGRAAVLLCAATTVYALHSKRVGAFGKASVFATAIAALLSFRVKALLSLAVAWCAIGVVHSRARSLAIAVVVLLGLGAAFTGLDRFVADDLLTYGSEQSARGALAAGSLLLASQHFPFGVGFGRYGSFVAAQEYSPFYRELGLAGRYGLQDPGRGFGGYLTDTAWPAVLGEAGWLGLLAFALGIVSCLFRLLRWAQRGGGGQVQLLAKVGVSWIGIFLVESTSAPVFSSAPSYPLLFVLIGILTSMFAFQTGTVSGRSDANPNDMRA